MKKLIDFSKKVDDAIEEMTSWVTEDLDVVGFWLVSGCFSADPEIPKNMVLPCLYVTIIAILEKGAVAVDSHGEGKGWTEKYGTHQSVAFEVLQKYAKNELNEWGMGFVMPDILAKISKP